METEKDKVKNIIELGIKAIEEKEFEKALKLFDQALKAQPDNVTVLNNKAIAYRKLRKLDTAEDTLKKALKIDSKSTMTLLNKARILRLLKKYDLALFNYEDILELKPNHPLAQEESEIVRELLSKQMKLNENESKKRESIEEEILKERKSKLIDSIEEAKNEIIDSVQRIKTVFEQGIAEEAIENKNKVLDGISTFNDEIYERINVAADEFLILDFKEESRDIIEEWENFREKQVEILNSLKK